LAERGAAHNALRDATGPDHERLDALFGGFAIGTPDGYRRFLTAHAGALPAIEQALDASGFADDLTDWPSRRRGAALAADLAAVGGDLPVALNPPQLDTPARRWGAAYVIEGSRLGGAFLARQVPAALPKAYLSTPQPAGNWRHFLAELEAVLTTPGDIEQAQTTARAVFALFEAGARQQLDQTHR
jgi:heme oxygenase